jgi:hypothetical protein
MLSPVVRRPGLVTGERLTVEEFLRRWEELPELKNAESSMEWSTCRRLSAANTAAWIRG